MDTEIKKAIQERIEYSRQIAELQSQGMHSTLPLPLSHSPEVKSPLQTLIRPQSIALALITILAGSLTIGITFRILFKVAPSPLPMENISQDSAIPERKELEFLLGMPYPLRLNFSLDDFSSGVKHLSIQIGFLDAASFEKLAFRIKGPADWKEKGSDLTIRLENRTREKADYNLKGLTDRWREVIIPLTDFKGISDWTNLEKLSFILEDWSIRNARLTFLIDQIRFIKRSTPK